MNALPHFSYFCPRTFQWQIHTLCSSLQLLSHLSSPLSWEHSPTDSFLFLFLCIYFLTLTTFLWHIPEVENPTKTLSLQWNDQLMLENPLHDILWHIQKISLVRSLCQWVTFGPELSIVQYSFSRCSYHSAVPRVKWAMPDDAKKPQWVSAEKSPVSACYKWSLHPVHCSTQEWDHVQSQMAEHQLQNGSCEGQIREAQSAGLNFPEICSSSFGHHKKDKLTIGPSWRKHSEKGQMESTVTRGKCETPIWDSIL